MRKLRRQSRTEEVSALGSKKLETNWRQTEDRLETKQETNKRQTKDKLKTNASPKGSKKRESKDKVESQVETELESNCRQTEVKPETKRCFSALSDTERIFVNFIYNECIQDGSLLTKELKVSFISEITQMPISTIKKGAQRLEKLGHVFRNKYKNGRGGWTVYQLSKNIYNEIRDIETRDKLNTNWRQTGVKVESQLETQLETSSSSSNSSMLLNNNTITTKQDSYDWLQEIQVPQNLKSLGFGVGHLKQLKNKFSLIPTEIQSGLESFSYDLEKGELERLKKRGIQNIIGYFFGAMKAGGYNSVHEGFVNAEELAEIEMIERIQKKKEESIARKNKLEELLFEQWLESKTEKEILEINKPVSKYLDMFHKSGLKDYFIKNDYDKFKQELT